LIGKSNLSRLIYKRSALVFSSPEDQKKTNTLKTIHEKINNKSLFNEIDYALDNLKFSNVKAPIILTSVSSKYFNLFELWNERINKNLPCEKIVIALDSISTSKLSKYNDLKVLDFSSYFFFDEVSNLPPLIRQNLWILRTAITKSLLKYNRKIYLLDLDAIVVDKGLPEFIDTLPHHDIVGQLGKFEIPLDVVKKFGFVICCGVLIINPSFKVANFFEKFFTRVVAELDDQVALNHFLEHEGIKNFKSNTEYLSFESHDLQWILPSNKYISRSIDYGIFIRHTPKAHNLKLFN
jgi:hypothetical protein